MRRGTIILTLLLLFFAAASFAADNGGFQFKKQPQLQQIRPKKPVRIKLKRTSKEDYSWELTGDDVDEVVRTDKRLKKLLGVQ